MNLQKKATRDSYGEALVELGQEHENLVVLDADLAKATKTATFQKAFPERFIDCGIAEANMMGVAAGLSTTGKVPFASTFAMFAAGRAFEQVRNTIGYPHLNVKIGATHASISVGEDGASHQCNEDLALMRTIPKMTVICPADHFEAKAAVRAAFLHDGPVYLRFGRMAVPVFNDETYKFELGKAVTVADHGTDVTVIATGLLVFEAMKAAEALKSEGIGCRVLNVHTIKPIDRDAIVRAAQETGCIVTAEEHSVVGGLGSAVSEVICETCPVPVLKLGVEDRFGMSGPAQELLNIFHLNAAGITEKVKQAIALK